MDSEIKKVYGEWDNKNASYKVNYDYVRDSLNEIDESILKCENALAGVGIGIGYTSQKGQIQNWYDRLDKLLRYIEGLAPHIDNVIDSPLKEDFKHKATETISHIRMENYSVDNTLSTADVIHNPNVMEDTYVNGKKDKLFLADFMGTGSIKYERGGMRYFHNIFSIQYSNLLSEGLIKNEGPGSEQRYLNNLYHQGEFTHDAGSPFLNFVSSALDMTIIKPLVESAVGEDLITGEDLTDAERKMKVVFAAVDVMTLGSAFAETKISELGAEQAIRAFAKKVTMEFASNTVSCGIGELGQTLNIPVPVTIMLSLAGDRCINVSVSGSAMMFKNSEGKVLREVIINEAELDKLTKLAGKDGGSAIENITEKEIKTAASESRTIDKLRPIEAGKKAGQAAKGVENTTGTVNTEAFEHLYGIEYNDKIEVNTNVNPGSVKIERYADETRGAENAVGAVGESVSKTVEELIDTSTQGRTTKGRTTQYERGGNYENAVDDFNSLNPQNVRELPNGKGYVGELSDGKVINVRNISSEGSPTIEIQNGNSNFAHRF